MAPLNWGLGHATRCIPIIEALLDQNAKPILGLDGAAGQLLKNRYPTLEQVAIPGHEVLYSKGNSQVWAMTKQMPALLSSIKKEHRLLKRFIPDYHIDAVISDQRFGLYAAEIPSVILTHQVHPLAPIGQPLLHNQNHAWLNKFDQVWVIDNAEMNLAGILSLSPFRKTSERIQSKQVCIGPLSRFQKHTQKRDPHYRIVGIVSGPEPHRQLLLSKLTEQLKAVTGEHLLLAGKADTEKKQDGNITIYGNMDDNELVPYILGCELLITRSGYSSIMDLHALGRPALLIPTPGQPEQEYLAERHGSSPHFQCQAQDNLNIQAALINAPVSQRFPAAKQTRNLVSALQGLEEHWRS